MKTVLVTATKFPREPLITVMSAAVNPATASLKVAVSIFGAMLLGDGVVDEIVTVGAAAIACWTKHM